MAKLSVDRALRQAKAHQLKGDPDQARALYNQILTAFPGNSKAKQGIQALQSTSPVSNAAQNPPQQQLNALIALYHQGRLAAVAEQAAAFTKEFSRSAVLWNILGAASAQTGQTDSALDAFRQAAKLSPNNSDAHNNMGNALKEQGKLDEAVAAYQRALAIKPDFAEAHNNMGFALQEQDKLDEAIAAYHCALEIKPGYAEAHNNMGAALKGQGKLDKAVAAYQRALAIKPDFAEAHYNMGVALMGEGKLDEAIAAYQRALAIKPSYAEAHNNMGNALKDQGKLDEAIDACQRALALKPNYARAHNNIGVALQGQGKPDEAIAAYQRALVIEPEDAEVKWNLSLGRILLGEYEQGWRLYESRLIKKGTGEQHYKFDKVAWRGEALKAGSKLLIYAEQGFGDVIQFCRYLPLLVDMGLEVIAEVPKPLLTLISTLNCPITLVAKGDKLPEFDAYCPLMSLPFAFATTVDTIPAQAPYLYADSSKLQTWRDKFGPQDRPRVGLVWSGSATHSNDRNRSLNLEQLSDLIALQSIEWHSLQKECRRQDEYFLNEHPEVAQHQNELNDFSDTAALLECMDLIISVDTSVAHLAGALGKPVWILLPFAPDYRWLLDRPASPWYPSAKLLRQADIGDWKSVVNNACKEVIGLIGN